MSDLVKRSLVLVGVVALTILGWWAWYGQAGNRATVKQDAESPQNTMRKFEILSAARRPVGKEELAHWMDEGDRVTNEVPPSELEALFEKPHTPDPEREREYFEQNAEVFGSRTFEQVQESIGNVLHLQDIRRELLQDQSTEHNSESSMSKK